MKAYLVQRHISQVLIEDVPDVIDVKPTTTLALLQGAQERRIRQQDILYVCKYHLDRLGLQKPQHARIEYLCVYERVLQFSWIIVHGNAHAPRR